MVHHRLLQVFMLAAVLSATPAWAYLGGFETEDGYFNDSQGSVRDVSIYNAGQYGTNGGGPGGIFANIPQNTGLYTKFDQGNVSDNYGELIVQHGGLAHSGSGSLVLRSTPGFGDTGGDGADYLYTFDNRDFGGAAPSAINSGILTFNFWMRPQASFFESGTVITTEFLNSAGDSVFALGTLGRGIFDAKPYIEWKDANGWHTTTILGNNAGWDQVLLSFDIDSGTITFSYFSSLTNTTIDVVSDAPAGANLDYLSGIHFTAAPNSEPTAFDDFSTYSPVPEPSSLLAVLAGGLVCCARRRRSR